jgi:energy-coupling factor transporter ATP-binding protein EcfA2
MIESIRFTNFKALRDTTLPLQRFTLLVGANGSGKSTALLALEALKNPGPFAYQKLITAGAARVEAPQAAPPVVLDAAFRGTDRQGSFSAHWSLQYGPRWGWRDLSGRPSPQAVEQLFELERAGIRVYALDPEALSAVVGLNPGMELDRNGRALAGVLDRLRDDAPERFAALNQELGRLLPEFDQILFETPESNQRGFLLRTRGSGHRIPAAAVSHGTLLALTLLTLTHLPSPPPVIGLEEPDRGIHPRLLRDVRDVLYRLCYPENYKEERPPVQVVATTQSPYFLDLFKDHPEEIVIAQKEGIEAHFEPLVARPDIREILADAPLGEVWYTGVLGGVPTNR